MLPGSAGFSIEALWPEHHGGSARRSRLIRVLGSKPLRKSRAARPHQSEPGSCVSSERSPPWLELCVLKLRCQERDGGDDALYRHSRQSALFDRNGGGVAGRDLFGLLDLSDAASIAGRFKPTASAPLPILVLEEAVRKDGSACLVLGLRKVELPDGPHYWQT